MKKILLLLVSLMLLSSSVALADMVSEGGNVCNYNKYYAFCCDNGQTNIYGDGEFCYIASWKCRDSYPQCPQLFITDNVLYKLAFKNWYGSAAYVEWYKTDTLVINKPAPNIATGSGAIPSTPTTNEDGSITRVFENKEWDNEETVIEPEVAGTETEAEPEDDPLTISLLEKQIEILKMMIELLVAKLATY